MAFNLYLRAPKEPRRSPPGLNAVVHLDEPGLSGYPLHHNLGEFFRSPHGPGEAETAFLLMALGVWAGDKLLSRRAAPDAWTRHLVLHLPADPALTSLAAPFAALLNFLTGDNWTLKPREVPLDLGITRKWPHAWTPQAVVLFSGGLDSLAGAIDLLEAGQRLLLVSHYDFGQLAQAQQRLAGALALHYGPDRVHHLGARVQLEGPELTLRSRSLLYLALGLTAAGAFPKEAALVIPENGWMSLNPPLTLNRLGTYSTRTTHPDFLERLTGLWRDAGIARPLLNPYAGLAKGQLLARCRDQGLLGNLYPLTLSCARPVAARWRGQGGGACGYCYPCLLRRVALHSLGWDRGEDYLLDILASPKTLTHRSRGRDLRAVLLALRTWEESPQEVAARVHRGALSADLAIRNAQAQSLLHTGFQEIGRFLEDKGPEWIKAYLGR